MFFNNYTFYKLKILKIGGIFNLQDDEAYILENRQIPQFF